MDFRPRSVTPRADPCARASPPRCISASSTRDARSDNDAGGNIFPDDVFIFNRSVRGGRPAPARHLHHQADLPRNMVAAWATTIAHHSDVGGIVPGSNALGATEIYQEASASDPQVHGARQADRCVWQLIALNVRLPDLSRRPSGPDAACTACERNMTDLFRRYAGKR